MRVTNALGSSTVRTVVVAVLVALGTAATVAAWMLGGPVIGLIVAAVASVVVVLAKALFEVTADLVRLQTRFTAQSASMSGRIEMVENQESDDRSRIERAEATAAKQQAFAEKMLDRVRAVETATGNQESVNDVILERVRAVEAAAGNQRGFNDAVLDRVRSVETATGNQASFNETVLERIRAVERSLGDLADTRRIADVVAGKTFHDARRLITQDEVSEIIRIGNDVLGFIISESQIRYIERVTLGLELLGTGRLAAHSADAVLRVITSLSRGDRILHAEIGVLSGLYAALLGRISGDAGVDVHQVLIDPFEGYYGESEFDALTLSTISADTVRRNLRMAGCDEEEYTILEGLSGDPATLQAAGGRRYDTILVDGDHSYEGVTTDIDAYGPLLRPEGLLLLDDYGNPAWPDVTRAIDEAAAIGKIEILATLSKTALARF
ncbi:MAG: class I SAM-dependent methyltransferase, partial [Acidimicrobiia bacterium]